MGETFQISKRQLPFKAIGYDAVKLLGDKSLAHRAMLFGALADGKSHVENFPDSGVTKALLGCLKALGVEVEVADNTLEVVGNGFQPFKKSCQMCDCKNSATTMRLLVGALFGTKTRAVIVGSDSLQKRPIRVDESMKELGYSNIVTCNGKLTMYITSFDDQPKLEIPKQIYTKQSSAQVKSALILAALGLKQQLEIVEQIKTRDHTENMLRFMGASLQTGHSNQGMNVVVVQPLVKPLQPLVGKLPGDISSAAFILAAAALVPNSEVCVEDVLLNETRLGFIDVLQKMGCKVDVAQRNVRFGEKCGDITLRSPLFLKQVEISDQKLVVDMIDEFPAIAALMAFATGISTVRNAKELRFKESDRIKSIMNAYQILGLECYEYEDGFSVVGSKKLQSSKPIEVQNDHRIAMAFSLLGLVGDVKVDNGDIIHESFPNFTQILDRMSA